VPEDQRPKELPAPLLKGAPGGCQHPLFAELKELSAEALVEQVLERSPSLAEMVEAWKAAQARYPQVTSLDDPMFAGTIGPGTFAPDDRGVEFAYRLELSQTYPWPGKLRLRGQNARALASAAAGDVGDMQLQLVESARRAFYDYYLVDRGLAVNRENLRLLRQFRKNAETRYSTGLVPQQDILQADVEIGRAQEREVSLERLRPVAIARINTLLHLPPDTPLPPPPEKLELGEALSEAAALRAWAVERRPDLRAIADRVKAEEASLALAQREFYPDFTPFVMYDRFMGNTSDNRDLATMLGVRLNLPVRLDRRRAAVEEAKARVGQRRAELARQIDQVNYQVQQAYEQVRESEQVVRLYEKTILPAARKNVEAAQSAYTTGRIPFLSLIEAQRNVVGLQDRYYEAVADYHRRRATLERVVGGPLVPGPYPNGPREAVVEPRKCQTAIKVKEGDREIIYSFVPPQPRTGCYPAGFPFDW
jgi:outer membrane protein TolC